MKALNLLDIIGAEGPGGLELSIGAPDPSALIEIGRVFRELGEPMPSSFQEMIRQCSIRPFSFGMFWANLTPSLAAELRISNIDRPGENWWGDGRRPEGLLKVSATEGFIVLLDTGQGSVRAFNRWGDSFDLPLIARDSIWFLRGAGTLYLNRDWIGGREEEADELAVDVGSDASEGAREFWREFIYI